MLYAIVAVLAIILDQAVKYLVESRVVLDAIGEDVVRLIPGFVHITNVHNFGAAFSFLSGARWFFVILCIAFVLVVVYVLVKDIINTPGARWMAVVVLAGAVGNCIDRIVCGYVVDMFEFEFFRFPVFNIADIFITCGAIAFCLCVLFEKSAPVQTNVPNPTPTAEEAQSAPRAKAQKKPLIRKHQKVEIPVFPKHEPAPEAPAIDPNDPFAEWEKRANPPKDESAAPSGTVVYTQPAAAEKPAAPEFPSAPAKPEIPAAPAQPEVPLTPAQPEVPAKPAKPAAEGDSFNLDDILAEFRDL